MAQTEQSLWAKQTKSYQHHIHCKTYTSSTVNDVVWYQFWIATLTSWNVVMQQQAHTMKQQPVCVQLTKANNNHQYRLQRFCISWSCHRKLPATTPLITFHQSSTVFWWTYSAGPVQVRRATWERTELNWTEITELSISYSKKVKAKVLSTVTAGDDPDF